MQKLGLKLKENLKSSLPVRVMQFGEGNFLRGFIDYMIFKMNEKELFNGRVVAIQPTPRGRVVPKLKEQDCLYTTSLHGIENDKAVEYNEIINSIADALNPYNSAQWQQTIEYALNPDVRFFVSNTTEAGLTYTQEQLFSDTCPQSFPGKLTELLYRRFEHFTKDGLDPSVIVMPCELLDNNGSILRDLVLKHAYDNNLDESFADFINNKCTFLNTLVDRVVSGFPADNADEYFAKFGYEDNLITCGETFHFMAIEGDDSLNDILPFSKAGLNVVICSDISPYRLRKVRLLNGGHTSSVPLAYLSGLETVDQMMSNKVFGAFVRRVLFDDIMPHINLDRPMLESFASSVINRFSDPMMHHQLSSILMNSTSKINARVLPSLLDNLKASSVCKRLCLSVAAYICLYKDAGSVPVTVIRDDKSIGSFSDDKSCVDMMMHAWSLYCGTLDGARAVVDYILDKTTLLSPDLGKYPQAREQIAVMLQSLLDKGALKTIEAVIECKQ